MHTWYAYPMESMLAVPAKDAGKFKCWRDFSGKPVFFSNAGFMNWLNYMRVFKLLGCNFKHVQIDLTSNADAMESGTIVGSGVYTTAGRSLPSYWKETEIRMDFRVVNPCPDEVAKIKAAGLAVIEVDPKGAFTKSVGPSKLLGVAILFGYNAGTNVPEDVVYKMLTALYKTKDESREERPGIHAPGQGLCRPAGAGNQRQSGHSGASGPGEVHEGAEGVERGLEGRGEQVSP